MNDIIYSQILYTDHLKSDSLSKPKYQFIELYMPSFLLTVQFR